MKKSLFSLCGLAALSLLAASGSPAQSAPQNRQDEVINFDRQVSAGTDTIKVLRSEAKKDINNYVTEVFELRSARAIEILPLVLDAVRAEGGTAQVIERAPYEAGESAEKALAASGTSYLQVVAPEFQIPSLKRLVEKLDQANMRSESGVRFNHIRIANRDAREVAAILKNTVLSKSGVVSVDSVTNTIYVEDSITDSERALVTAAYYDVPPPQVQIRVNVVEVEGTDDSVLGLEWDAWKETLTGAYIFEYGEGYTHPGTEEMTGGSAIIGLGGDGLARFLNYMSERGKAEIVLQTTLTALNNEPATLSNMTPIPNYRYEIENFKMGSLAQVRYDQEILNTAVAAAGANGDPVTGVASVFGQLSDSNTDLLRLMEKFEHAEGLALNVQPLVGTETVSLKVDALLNSLVDVTKQETPVIANRHMSSRVSLKPGETLKLGSFDRKATVTDERGIPLLMDIPYAGYLFKKEVTVRRDKRVVVFLTPEVVNNGLYSGRRLDDRTVFTTVPTPAGAPILTANDKSTLTESDKATLGASQATLDEAKAEDLALDAESGDKKDED